MQEISLCMIVKDEENVIGRCLDSVKDIVDEIIIVDYKLKNIEDENYRKQLSIYKEYIYSKTNKDVFIYLYSILNDNLKEIE